MNKIFMCFLLLFSTFINAYAQDVTSERYDRPARYEFRVLGKWTYLRLDSKAGNFDDWQPKAN